MTTLSSPANVGELQAKLREVVAENTRLREDIATLEVSYNNAVAEVNALREQLDIAEKTVTQLGEENNALVNDNNRMVAELENGELKRAAAALGMEDGDAWDFKDFLRDTAG